MLLGKRTRPPMKKTTSVTELSLDALLPAGRRGPANPVEDPISMMGPSNVGIARRPQQQRQRQQGPWDEIEAATMICTTSIQPTRNARRHSADFAAEATQFLRECGLCKRRLGPGRDTFMYRGELAFCSLECRQQQMALDERKEKCSVSSARKGSYKASSDAQTAATTEATTAI